MATSRQKLPVLMMLSVLGSFKTEASPVEGQSLQEKDKKGRKGRAEKMKTTKSLKM